MERDFVIADFKKLFPKAFVKKGEEFDDRTSDSIWLSAEEPEITTMKGLPIFNYYAMGSHYELGVLVEFMAWLEERGWYAEWYDPGTIFLYEG